MASQTPPRVREIEAAKYRLTCAEKWAASAAEMVTAAQTQAKKSQKELEEARAYFKDVCGVNPGVPAEADKRNRSVSGAGNDDMTVDGIMVVVEGSGIPSINGTYKQHGSYDGAPMYIRPGVWQGSEVDFKIYRYSRKWYISINPTNSKPGSGNYIDFYVVFHESVDDVPPINNWTVVAEGVYPAPQVYPVDSSANGRK